MKSTVATYNRHAKMAISHFEAKDYSSAIREWEAARSVGIHFVNNYKQFIEANLVKMPFLMYSELSSDLVSAYQVSGLSDKAKSVALDTYTITYKHIKSLEDNPYFRVDKLILMDAMLAFSNAFGLIFSFCLTSRDYEFSDGGNIVALQKQFDAIQDQYKPSLNAILKDMGMDPIR
jgi:hypothetical protein